MLEEKTYRCPRCLDRGFALADCVDPERMQFNGGKTFQVAAACRDCGRGAKWAAGYWRRRLETDRGLSQFAAWERKDRLFASAVRAVIDAGDPADLPTDIQR